MQSNPKKIGKYEIGKVLGKGNFSKVRLATDTGNGEKYAIKIIDKALLARDHLEDQIRREISIMKVLRHKYVVQMREAFQTTKHMYVVMELVEGGELFDIVADQGRLSEDTARRYFQQLIVAVKYCHANKIAHRDLKLENLLLDQKNNLKISDFGLANMQATPDSSMLRTVCGTPNYVAPEVIKMNNQPRAAPGEQRATGYNGFTADVWSCGIILFIMLSGRQAFDDDDLKALFNKIERGQYQMSRHITEGARALIEKMLCIDPSKRIVVDEIIRHPWFQVNFDPSELTAGVERPQLDEQAVANAVTDVSPGAGPLSPLMSPQRGGAPPLSALQLGGSLKERTTLSPEQGQLAGGGAAAPAASAGGAKAGGSGTSSPGNASSPTKAQQAGGGGGGGGGSSSAPASSLDGFNIANMLISTALQSSPYVDLGNGASSSASPASSPTKKAATTGPLGKTGGASSPTSSSSPGSMPTTSLQPVFGSIRQWMLSATAAQARQLCSDWLKSILPSALRGAGGAGGGAQGGQNLQELRGFLTTPRGIMTFMMDVVPTCVGNVTIVQARKGMGDLNDFLDTIKGFGSKMGEAKVLLSEVSRGGGSGNSPSNEDRRSPTQQQQGSTSLPPIGRKS